MLCNTARSILMLAMVCLIGVGCAPQQRAVEAGPRIGDPAPRVGDEIMVAGRMFHTGAPVVLWFDPGGYDAYRVERRFVPLDQASWAESSSVLRSPNRYSTRRVGMSPEDQERTRHGNWTLDDVRTHVDQFVIHYDVCGVSRRCFRVLHDLRGLSVHFMLDIDGTIYQTLDVQERAWHAGTANDRSVGIEIANMGAYRDPDDRTLRQWYARDEEGTRITIPGSLGDGGVRTPGFVGRPSRPEPVSGEIHGTTLHQYDLTDEQYESLIKLTAALHLALPGIELDYPRESDGSQGTRELTQEEYDSFGGLIGHYHITRGKIDPGPAFDWDRVVEGARAIVSDRAREGARYVRGGR
ncbi:MAG: N-acetylmuramoyl-L-alanine amidase [Phycisphaerales bacterium]|nr:N-acetylmuramoyl-L-alanine amidase [Phycisphaerales bacterium]